MQSCRFERGGESSVADFLSYNVSAVLSAHYFPEEDMRTLMLPNMSDFTGEKATEPRTSAIH